MPKVQEKLLPDKYPADTYLPSIYTNHFISERLFRREPLLRKQVEKVQVWMWFRVRDRTVVILVGENVGAERRNIIGLGWAERGKRDLMNEFVGVAIALVRALRMVKI